MSLKDLVICCSGKLSVSRTTFSKLLVDNGATIASSVKKDVNVLVSTPEEVQKRTTKVKAALAKNIHIVAEVAIHQAIATGCFVADSFSLVGQDKVEDAAPVSKKRKRDEITPPHDDSAIDTKLGKSSALDSYTMCFSGKLSQSRKVMTTFAKNHGASVVGTVSKACNLLVTTEKDVQDATSKIASARASGIPIVSEGYIQACAVAKSSESVDINEFALSSPDDATAEDDSKMDVAKADIAAEETSKTIFDGCVFVFSGLRGKASKAVQASIYDFGGEYKPSVTKAATHLIVTAQDALHPTAKVKRALALGLPVLLDTVIDAAIAANSLEKVLKDHAATLPDEDSEPAAKKARIAFDSLMSSVAPPTSEDKAEFKMKSKSTKRITKRKKGNVPLDPFLPDRIQEDYHVLEEDAGIWDCMLNQTNVESNNNKFYVIQLLEGDTQKQYFVFNRWGRIGYKGQFSLKGPMGKDGAKKQFEAKFKAKTGHVWADRLTAVPKARKYTYLELSYDDEEGEKAASKPPDSGLPQSTMDPRLVDLMMLISDVKMFKTQMKEMDYDADKLPLGKLSQRVIRAGYEILKMIADVLEGGPGDLERLSSQFYSTIPHDFGYKSIRGMAIDTKPKLKKKLELLESLDDIEVAYRLLKDVKEAPNMHPADFNYQRLKCPLRPIEEEEPIMKLIQRYVQNSHGVTHRGYTLEVDQVFEIAKEEESDRFEKDLDRMLLWHGSRLTNYVGILSQGLRIAPPEAPSTGYMFGKGIYFADSVSKSANYCNASAVDPHGLLLLCDVALGKTNDLLHADYDADKLPAGKDSTKGCGKNIPDPRDVEIVDGKVVVPLGKGCPEGAEDSSLLYNEFIVYRPSQVKMRYLVKTKMNFK